jgi:hypothetical protein
MILLTLCGSLGSLTAVVHAQEIGTIVGVPVSELARFEQVNAFPSRTGSLSLPALNLRLLHTSATLAAPFDTAIATVSLTLPTTGDPARQVSFPLTASNDISPLFRLINAWDVYSSPRIVGTGNEAALQVDVSQPEVGKLLVSRNRFLLVPIERVGSLEATNSGAKLQSLHRQQASLGGHLIWVELVATEAGTLSVPTTDLVNAILALNSNVEIIGSDTFSQSKSIAVR